ncbi:hypothetical protein [Aeromonas salmonicida]|uniref:Uncharacterized protein n=1 Tax=Aeromonas salmonicida TaxID=645 RepID=A0AAX3VXC2_AERSA|nr:hypothetical protein [Aeromonas salmonicida]WHF38506.1 hypothetical protein QLQ87_09265 [Aeromonas salmonicida]
MIGMNVIERSPCVGICTFGTCSDLGKLTYDTNGFTLALPGNPAETWVWDSRTLMLHK